MEKEYCKKYFYYLDFIWFLFTLCDFPKYLHIWSVNSCLGVRCENIPPDNIQWWYYRWYCGWNDNDLKYNVDYNGYDNFDSGNYGND